VKAIVAFICNQFTRVLEKVNQESRNSFYQSSPPRSTPPHPTHRWSKSSFKEYRSFLQVVKLHRKVFRFSHSSHPPRNLEKALASTGTSATILPRTDTRGR